MGATFLTSLKIVIYEGFYWGIKYEEGGVKKGGIRYKGEIGYKIGPLYLPIMLN